VTLNARCLTPVLSVLRDMPTFWLCYRLYCTLDDDSATLREDAMRRAEQLLHVEQRLTISVERRLNRCLARHETAAVMVNYYYVWGHFIGPILTLLCLRAMGDGVYRSARRRLLMVTCVCMFLFRTIPAAPPRLLSSGFGFVDTVARFPVHGAAGERGLLESEYQYGALPSIHMAWSYWVLTSLRMAGAHASLRAISVAHVLMTGLAAVATGNHYVLDLAASVAVIRACAAVEDFIRGTARRRCAADAFSTFRGKKYTRRLVALSGRPHRHYG
jgi:diacylglycerol O-acyltransferase